MNNNNGRVLFLYTLWVITFTALISTIDTIDTLKGIINQFAACIPEEIKINRGLIEHFKIIEKEPFVNYGGK